MTTLIITFFILAVCFAILNVSRWLWALKRSAKADVFTKKEPPTLFDVKEMIKAGEDELAVTMYCRIYQCGVKEAQKSVQDLKRSIKNIN